MKISASILDCDFLHLENEIKRLENAKVDYIHIDPMDGHFVPNISFGISMIRDIKKATSLPLDVHLMFQYPSDFIDRIAEFMDYDNNSFITIHSECNSIVAEALAKIKNYGIKAGIALNPTTPIEKLNSVINDVDLILQMTVWPGYGKQKLITEALNKTKQIAKIKNANTIIEVDGGINEENISLLKDVDMAVVGSALWKSNNLNKTVKLLKGE